jgi:cytoskeletal protein CcmA (bactofilin family)
MFKKNKDQKLETFIGANSFFRGNVNIKGALRVDGAFEGDIETDWLILGEKGRIQGNISAKCIVIGGKVDGNLSAKETVEIKSKGAVNGNVSTQRLSVQEGGLLNGRTVMQTGESKIIELHKEKAGGEKN